MLEIKYIKNTKPDIFLSELGISQRTYFRYLEKAESSFAKECSKRGYDEKWFMDNFFDQSWIKCLYNSIKDKEEI